MLLDAAPSFVSPPVSLMDSPLLPSAADSSSSSSSFPLWAYLLLTLLFFWAVSGTVHILVGWHYQEKEKEGRWGKWKEYVAREKEKLGQQQPSSSTPGSSNSDAPPTMPRRQNAAVIEEVFDDDSDSEDASLIAGTQARMDSKDGFQIF
jgi:hypothetical protein